jgi:GNAT superfamily N-acetyltransferase
LTKQTVDGKLSIKINILAVRPAIVRRGIARYMMQVVETVAKKCRYTHVFFPVVSLNQHLIDMYSKWGYNIIETKTLVECDVDPEIFAIPCHMFIMEKKLL